MERESFRIIQDNYEATLNVETGKREADSSA